MIPTLPTMRDMFRTTRDTQAIPATQGIQAFTPPVIHLDWPAAVANPHAAVLPASVLVEPAVHRATVPRGIVPQPRIQRLPAR